MRLALYIRVSSEDQADPHLPSVPTQLDECRALALQLDPHSAIAEYVDAKRYRVGNRWIEPSGERPDRPAWLRLLADIRAGKIDGVIAWHSSRLYRGYKAMADFLDAVEKRHVVVHLVKETFDLDIAPIHAWADHRENRARAQRTRMGQRGRVQRALNPTRQPPAYIPLRDPHTGKITSYQLDERFRPFLDQLASLFLKRLSYAAIAREVGSHNPISGRHLDGATVRAILLNPWYRGLVTFGRRSKHTDRLTQPGAHAPAWDKATCDRVEREIARRAAAGLYVPHIETQIAILSGVLRCGYCHRIMTAGRANSKTIAVSYRCNHNLRVRNGEVPGVPHIPNNLTQRKALRQLKDILATLPLDAFDEFLAEFSGFTITLGDLADLRRQFDLTQSQLVELQTAIAVHTSPTVLTPLIGEQKRLQAQGVTLQQKLDQSTEKNIPAVQPHNRDAFYRLAAHLDALDDPTPDLRIILQDAFNSLYAAAGRLTLTPPFGADSETM